MEYFFDTPPKIIIIFVPLFGLFLISYKEKPE